LNCKPIGKTDVIGMWKWKLLTSYGIKNKYFTNLIYFEFCNFLNYLYIIGC